MSPTSPDPAEGRGNIRLVRNPPASERMAAIIEEILNRHGFTTQQAVDAVRLVKELDGLGLEEKLFLKALEIIDRKHATIGA